MAVKSIAAQVKEEPVVGYLPADTPPWGAMLSLAFQQVLTMFPATVLVAILTKFDVGVTLLASGVGTIVALLVSSRRIPMYYGSSFSYISVVITAMSLYANDCFANPATFYCPEGVRLVQVGTTGPTAPDQRRKRGAATLWHSERDLGIPRRASVFSPARQRARMRTPRTSVSRPCPHRCLDERLIEILAEDCSSGNPTPVLSRDAQPAIAGHHHPGDDE